jgi:hypothetical protein
MSKFGSPSGRFGPSFSQGSYFDRLEDRSTHLEKQALATFVSAHLVNPDQRVFMCTGSTVCLAGQEVLKSVKGVSIMTNSVPLAKSFMDLAQSQKLAPWVSLDVMGGQINAVTGMIESSAFRKTRCCKAFLAPHGIEESGLVGNRDVGFLRKAIGAHDEVILLATWDKFFRPGKEYLKKPGHIRKEIRQGRRYCIVVPDFFPKDLSASDRRRCEELLERLEKEVGFVVHRAPQKAG